jgi:TAT-translocated FGD2 family F420-dependent dehydrogenase
MQTHESSANIQTMGPILMDRRRTLLMSSGALAAAAMGGGTQNAAFAQSTGSHGGAGPKARSLYKGMVGFMLAHEQFPVPQLVEFGARAEKAGFDLLATSDHIQPWQANQGHAGEAWVTLGALARQTNTVWMGPTVTCPTLRYRPEVVAQTFASLTHLSGGQIFLGLGSGEALNEQAATGQWPSWRERWDRLIEASEIIRKLWTGEQLTHKGKFYTADVKLYDPPAKPIPLLLAANGPKAMRLAGEHGDGLITDPQTWKQHKAQWQAGVKATGRDPNDLPVLVEQFVVVGDESQATKAAHLWRFLPKAFKGYQNIPDPREIQRRAEAEIPIPQLISEWTVGTDPAAHIKAMKDLFNSGVTIVNVHSGQADQHAVIDFYGSRVIPQLHAASVS